jgi:hypothetical protein
VPTYVVPVHPDHLRSITDPVDDRIRTYYALVNVFDLPQDLSLSPDPRVPKVSKITRRIVQSLREWDGRFHILNRGIVISAHSAEYDPKQRLLALDIPDDDDNYGILDGGHTKLAVEHALEGLVREAFQETPQHVRLEIMLGVKEILGRIASARNFSEDVKAISLANYELKLEWLKDAVQPYASQVRWSENDPAKMDALELIQILSAANPFLFGPTNHPLEAYKNTGKCLAYITEKDERYGYRRLAEVALDIWRLYDVIRHDWWDLYRLEDPDTGKRGRPGRVAEVATRKRGHRNLMHYVTLGKDGDPEQGDKHVEKGLAIPLLAGFRVLLEEGPDGSYHWSEDPIEFFRRNGRMLVRRMMDLSDDRQNNPHLVGRDRTVYQSVYELIELTRFREAASRDQSSEAPRISTTEGAVPTGRQPPLGRHAAVGNVGRPDLHPDSPYPSSVAQATAKTPAVTSTRQQRATKPRTRRKPGEVTPHAPYVRPILQTLCELGGKGQKATVIRRVGELMAATLNDQDRKPLAGGEMTWENKAGWTRKALVAAGMLSEDSPHGIWEITESGRQWLEVGGDLSGFVPGWRKYAENEHAR